MDTDILNTEGILLVSEAKGYIVTSFRDKLIEEVGTVYEGNGIESIERIDGGIAAIVIYVDELVVRDTQLLVYIKDKSTEDNIPIFMIGNEQDLTDICNLIPERMIQKMFVRPVNIKDVVKDIRQFLEEHDKTHMKKILAVDDSELALHNIKTWLDGSYQVMLADSGVNAIKVMSLNKPDLILMDYEMPICDGRLTLEMIRGEKEFADIPVVFLTGKSDRESILKVMELHPVGYLLKTTKPAELKRFVDDFFEKQKAKDN